jgi:hypothetical protein
VVHVMKSVMGSLKSLAIRSSYRTQRTVG